MDDATRSTSLAPVAIAYAATAAAALAALPRLAAPARAYGASGPGELLLGRNPAEGLLWGLGLAATLAAASHGLTRWTRWGRRLSRLLGLAVGRLHPVDAVLLAGLSGLAEELLFRGLALPYLGLAASSALFGAAHLIPRRGLWIWGLWAALVGAALGTLGLRTGGLLGPMVAHAGTNAVGLLVLARPGRAPAP